MSLLSLLSLLSLTLLGFYDEYDFDRVEHQIGLEQSLQVVRSREPGGLVGALKRHPSQLSSGVYLTNGAAFPQRLKAGALLTGQSSSGNMSKRLSSGSGGSGEIGGYGSSQQQLEQYHREQPYGLRLESFNPSAPVEQWDKMVQSIHPSTTPIPGDFPVQPQNNSALRQSVSLMLAKQNPGGYRPPPKRSAAHLAVHSSNSSDEGDLNDPLRPSIRVSNVCRS